MSQEHQKGEKNVNQKGLKDQKSRSNEKRENQIALGSQKERWNEKQWHQRAQSQKGEVDQRVVDQNYSEDVNGECSEEPKDQWGVDQPKDWKDLKDQRKPMDPNHQKDQTNQVQMASLNLRRLLNSTGSLPTVLSEEHGSEHKRDKIR